MESNKETQVSEEETLMALQLATGSVVAMVLKSAIELDLLDIILAKAGPGLSGAEIALQLQTTNPDAPAMVDRMLRLLACHSVVQCSFRRLPGGAMERLYGVAPMTKLFTKSNVDQGSIASLCLMMQDKVNMECWYHLKDVVLEGGIPFNRAYGMNSMKYRATDPRFSAIFNNSMSDYSNITVNKLLQTYNGFDGLNSLVDVGGGTGTTLNMIVSKYPSIKGINFDLHHVIENAPAYSGVEHVSGDMFVSVPKGDAIILKLVCHNWSDEHCLKLLKNCFDAIPKNGKVIVVECIIPEAPDSSLATTRVAKIDAVMLAHNPGGKERSENEFEALAKCVGFKRFRVACDFFYFYVMEFLKN